MSKEFPADVVLGRISNHEPVVVSGVDDSAACYVDKDRRTYDERINGRCSFGAQHR